MTKIEALEKTIYNLENGVYEYNWSSLSSCNCGILARTIMNGFSPMDAGLLAVKSIPQMPDKYDLFSDRTHCLNTGIKLPKVFEALEKCGFTDQEMKSLEFLNDAKIIDRMPEGTILKFSRKSLIDYLTAWVEILKEKAQKPERVKTVYVSVPETIKEQTGELILS